MRGAVYGDVWCGAELSVEDSGTVGSVTCRPCLLSVIDYAEDARHRLSELPYAETEPPPCGCRTGAHPPRENYLKVEGAVCKLGWLT
jgi:hypothetical protein